MKRYLIPVVLPLLFIGCRGPDAAFVAAERATHDALAPDYAHYFNDDASLSDTDKGRKQRMLDLWERDIAQQETELKGGK